MLVVLNTFKTFLTSPDLTEMKEVFCFAAPWGILGRLTEILVLRRYMRKLLRERNDALRKIAEGRMSK